MKLYGVLRIRGRMRGMECLRVSRMRRERRGTGGVGLDILCSWSDPGELWMRVGKRGKGSVLNVLLFFVVFVVTEIEESVYSDQARLMTRRMNDTAYAYC